jgi:hypothetical protein
MSQFRYENLKLQNLVPAPCSHSPLCTATVTTLPFTRFATLGQHGLVAGHLRDDDGAESGSEPTTYRECCGKCWSELVVSDARPTHADNRVVDSNHGPASNTYHKHSTVFHKHASALVHASARRSWRPSPHVGGDNARSGTRIAVTVPATVPSTSVCTRVPPTWSVYCPGRLEGCNFDGNLQGIGPCG